MLTKTKRGRPGLTLGVLTVLLSSSGLVQAQQSGLFPNHPIKRQRVPCPAEDPIYKLYRNQFYGYFPTQWRKFPEGWNLPNPEGPNTAQALKASPIEETKPSPSTGEGEEPEPPAERGGQRPIPTPPPENERSPFEMDRPGDGGNAAPGAGAAGRPSAAPRGTTPPAGAGRSPFEMPPDDAGTEPGPATPRPRAPQPTRPSQDAPLNPTSPDLNPPGDTPASPRTSLRDGRGRDAETPDSGPLLAMPDATLPAVEEAAQPGNSNGTSATREILGGPGATAPVASTDAGANQPSNQPSDTNQPSGRRGRLSWLFSGSSFSWLRR
jgi:hypothetical protein